MRLLRWILDVVRGYIRAADGRERALELLHGNELDERYIGAFADAVDAISAARLQPGPLGVGARIAVSEDEIAKLAMIREELVGIGTSMQLERPVS